MGGSRRRLSARCTALMMTIHHADSTVAFDDLTQRCPGFVASDDGPICG
jgi:hypothetical protein